MSLPPTASDKPEVGASMKEIARGAANNISDVCGEFGPEDGGYNTILKAITAALAPVVAERDEEKARRWQASGELAQANQERQLAREDIKLLSGKLQALQAELEQAKLDLLHLENLLNGEDAPKVDGLNIPLPLSSRFYNWMTKTTAELAQAKELLWANLDRDREDLSLTQLVTIAANGMHWRDTEIKDLRVRLATAEADTKRLDWLEQQPEAALIKTDEGTWECEVCPPASGGESTTIRAAIDSAAQAKGAQQP